MKSKETLGEIVAFRTLDSKGNTSPKAGRGYLDQIVHGRAEALIPTLPDDSVNLVVTSPPYAMQRAGTYASVPEAEYPQWMAGIMRLLMPKMKLDGSVIINIRPHVREGQISDYVLRTRLAVRAAGWCEIDELVWYASDKPPSGHTTGRLRRSWESLLWFAPSNRPYCNPRAAQTKMTWSRGGRRRKAGSLSKGGVMHGAQHCVVAKPPRCSDVITAYVGTLPNGIGHSAMFPPGLPDFLIKTFSRPGDFVIDPFAGSGTTCLSAQSLRRRHWGCDCCEDYVAMARARLMA